MSKTLLYCRFVDISQSSDFYKNIFDTLTIQKAGLELADRASYIVLPFEIDQCRRYPNCLITYILRQRSGFIVKPWRVLILLRHNNNPEGSSRELGGNLRKPSLTRSYILLRHKRLNCVKSFLYQIAPYSRNSPR